jgi:hypothetical protein
VAWNRVLKQNCGIDGKLREKVRERDDERQRNGTWRESDRDITIEQRMKRMRKCWDKLAAKREFVCVRDRKRVYMSVCARDIERR